MLRRCDQYCPSNLVTTIFQIRDALYADFFTLIRLIAKCFGDNGIAGCICQLSLTLQPAWRRFSTNKDIRCENGDPFVQLLKQLDSLIVKWAEDSVNRPIVAVNKVFNVVNKVTLGAVPKDPIPYVCLPTRHEPYRCHRHYNIGGNVLHKLTQCEEQENLANLCFYARVKQICGDSTSFFGDRDTMLNDWMALFSTGFEDLGNLEKEFAAAFADSYDSVLDPLLVKLLEAAEESASNEAVQEQIDARRDICSSNAFASAMSLGARA